MASATQSLADIVRQVRIYVPLLQRTRTAPIRRLRKRGDLFDEDPPGFSRNFLSGAGVSIERTALMFDRAVHWWNLLDLTGELRENLREPFGGAGGRALEDDRTFGIPGLGRYS